MNPLVVARRLVPLMGALGMVFSPAIAAAKCQITPMYTVFTPRRSGESQDGHRVTLDLQDVMVPEALHQLAAKAGMALIWSSANVPLVGTVTATFHDVAVTDALKQILHGTGAEARISSDGQTILVTRSKGGQAEASGVIAGRVTDSASGQGLGGASVKIAGTKLATVTSDSGHFTLRDVPSGDQVLTVRLFGYRPTERTVTVEDSAQTRVSIVMVPVPTVLSGVVTTATGLQRKVEVGNDITTLNVDSIMQVAPITSVTDLLETRVPGLTVLHSSGVPGDPSRIRLRGASSVTGNNDPIVVVDGVRVYANQSDQRNNNLAPSNSVNGGVNAVSNVPSSYAAPSPLDQIDPNSIATIEVLKGPSASALYGSDAAKGVIVITTKNGQAGHTQWNLAFGQGVNWLPGAWPVNFYKFGYDVQNENFGLCAWNDLSCHVDSLVAFQALNDPQFSVFSHGSDQTASLTVSGGASTLTYSLTGSAAGDVGNLKLPAIEQQRYESFYGPIPGWMVRPDNYTTYGGTGQLTAQPNPNLRVTLTSSLFNSAQQRSSLEGAIAQLEGEYLAPTTVDASTKPLIQNDVERATDQSLSSTNALTLSWTPVRWLPLTATGGLNTIQRVDETLVPYGISYGGIGVVSASNSFVGDTTGSYGLGRGTSEDKTLTVGTTVPLKLVNLAVGANLEEEATADITAYTTQLSPGVTEPSVFPTGIIHCSPSCFSQSTVAASTYGWYVEPRLNFASKFFVSPGFRLDGGSNSGTSGGFTGGLSAFPKIDLSYVAVDQSHPRGWLTLLRPRLAFGFAGVQPGPTEKLRLINANDGGGVGPLNDSTLVPLAVLSTFGNTQLQPEHDSELEGGFDAELWHGRLSVTYTQYNKTNHNAILSIPVAPSVGAGSNENNYGGFVSSSIDKNIGVTRNTGTEATVNVQVLQSRALSWNIGANLSNDNSLVVSLNKGQQPFCFNGTPQDGIGCIVPGYPLFSDFTRPIVSFLDANHDGIIEPNEIRTGDSAIYLGQSAPKYQFTINTGITLLNGRLNVNASFAYQNGLLQDNQAAVTSGAFLSQLNQPNTPLATQAAVVAGTCGSANTQSITGCSPQSTSLVGVFQTVNTFRFQTLSINYNLPATIARWFRVPRMTVALQGSNLGLSTNYHGKDPNVNAFSTVSAGESTEDLGQIPDPRVWWLKLSLGN